MDHDPNMGALPTTSPDGRSRFAGATSGLRPTKRASGNGVPSPFNHICPRARRVIGAAGLSRDSGHRRDVTSSSCGPRGSPNESEWPIFTAARENFAQVRRVCGNHGAFRAFARRMGWRLPRPECAMFSEEKPKFRPTHTSMTRPWPRSWQKRGDTLAGMSQFPRESNPRLTRTRRLVTLSHVQHLLGADIGKHRVSSAGRARSPGFGSRGSTSGAAAQGRFWEV